MKKLKKEKSSILIKVINKYLFIIVPQTKKVTPRVMSLFILKNKETSTKRKFSRNSINFFSPKCLIIQRLSLKTDKMSILKLI